MLQICQNIAQARVSREKTQEEMAILLGIKRSKYKNWEVATEPNLSEIKTIAKVLEMPAYKLLEGIIEFEEEVDKRPPVNISTTLEASQIDRIKFSLGVLAEVFSPSPGSRKGKNPDPLDLGEFEGRKKRRSASKAKGKLKGT